MLVLSGMPAGGTAAAEPRFDLTPFASYRISGELQGAAASLGAPGDGGGWGFSAGLYRDSEGFYELLYSRRNASLRILDAATSASNVRIEYVHLGGTLLLPQVREGVGFVSATLGLTRLEAAAPRYGSENKFSVSLGGGIRFPLAERLHATLAMRGYLTFVDSRTELVCLSAEGEAGCLIRASGSSFWEIEALAGIGLAF